jgi:hypothetical protein
LKTHWLLPFHFYTTQGRTGFKNGICSLLAADVSHINLALFIFLLTNAALKPEDSYWYFCDPELPLCGIYSYPKDQTEYEQVSIESVFSAIFSRRNSSIYISRVDNVFYVGN